MSNPATPRPRRRKKVLKIVAGVVLLILVIAAIPFVIHALHTVSTDDAYVNGHVTFVAPRVAGQVMKVFVDDNNRVHKGDLLVELDKEPYQVQVNIAQAALVAAASDFVAAQSQVRAMEGQARSLRYSLQHAIEGVDDQIAQLRSKVATLASEKAATDKAQADYDRALPLLNTGAITTEEVDHRKQDLLVAQAGEEEALQEVYEIRVDLGLPAKPTSGTDLTQVPDNLDQTFSTVKQAQASLMQAAAQLGVYDSFDKTPTQMLEDFYRRDPTGKGDIDWIYTQILKSAPSVKQAEAKMLEAKRSLDQALLNLQYCDVVSEIDGVVTRRDVNPGNNVIAGQSLMAVRSLTDIWVDANFKETQLGDIRIGQSAELDVDMYGSRHTFHGHVTGFTFGTGSTLALLPAENATGNFVKVVQRLPVRIDLTDYDPETMPLFVGLSVNASVNISEQPTGPDAGKVLQPYLPTLAPPAPVVAPPAPVLPPLPGPMDLSTQPTTMPTLPETQP